MIPAVTHFKPSETEGDWLLSRQPERRIECRLTLRYPSSRRRLSCYTSVRQLTESDTRTSKRQDPSRVLPYSQVRSPFLISFVHSPKEQLYRLKCFEADLMSPVCVCRPVPSLPTFPCFPPRTRSQTSEQHQYANTTSLVPLPTSRGGGEHRYNFSPPSWFSPSPISIASLPLDILEAIFLAAIDVPRGRRPHGGYLESWQSNETMQQLALVCKGWVEAGSSLIICSFPLHSR
jgi:hypothetical protein